MSATGPGKPYLKTPAGSTGETSGERTGCVATATGGTGTETGVGTGGRVAEEGRYDCGTAVGGGVSLLRELETKRRLSDAPNAADVPATMARVVFDMSVSCTVVSACQPWGTDAKGKKRIGS